MDDDTEAPDAPSSLPSEVVDALDRFDEEQLRAVIDYAQERQQYVHPSLTDRIEAGPNEEIVRIDEHEGYADVVKKEPCGEGCEDCPHGRYHYRVHEEPRPDGGTQLHWTYLGEIRE